MSVIRYADTYAPSPFSAYAPSTSAAQKLMFPAPGSTWSMIGLIRYATPAEAAPYTSMAATATANRPR